LPMLKQALAGFLNKEEIASLSSSFDVIGSIAIIRIPVELLPKQELIATQILNSMKNVRTVLRQASDVRGEFRLRDLAFVAGEEKYETIYKEGGCLFKVNVKEAYFSPRLSTERERIASLVQNGEHILNMFAGIGTFSIVIAKGKECVVESIDKNPKAIALAIQSLGFNKHLKGNVFPQLADAGEYARAHQDEFDRVLMLLPERSKEFLDAAFRSAKNGAMIHYYVHAPQSMLHENDWIKKDLESVNLSKNYKLHSWKKVREVGPRYIQAVADLEVYS
jgi:tRNA (guanine37-N1)-methyltransferase